MKTGAVIVAAGMSSRMGEFKPLKKIGDKTMIEHVIDTFLEINVDTILVVTGRNADQMQTLLKKKNIAFIQNPNYQNTEMFDSAKLGLAQLNGRADKIFFTPGDIPLFQADTVRKLLEAEGKIVKPVFNGRGGHPLLLDASTLPMICSYTGEGGMKGALLSCKHTIRRVEVADVGILQDADTVEDFEKIVDLYRGMLI